MFAFCRFCVVIRFFHPRHNGQLSPISKDFLSQILPITYIFLSEFLRKSQYFPFWMFSAKQGNYCYHFYNIFGMTRSLTGDWNPGPPALKASTLPLGYRGGGVDKSEGYHVFFLSKMSLFKELFFNHLPHTVCDIILR